MSTAKKEAQLSRALPARQGALRAEEIRAECPKFRILIIGKANAGKTTILRKVCNAKPDAKPIIYDAEGKEVRQEIPTKVRLGNLAVLAETNHNDLGHHDSLGYYFRRLSIFDGTRDVLRMSPTLLLMSSTLLLRLSRPNLFIIVSDDLLAWKT
jgi:GTPase SAR1 family protein